MTPTGKNSMVRLTRVGGLVRIAPSVPALGHFRVARLEADGTGNSLHNNWVPLFGLLDCGSELSAVVFPGLLRPIRGLLRENQIKFTDETAAGEVWTATPRGGSADPAVARFAGSAGHGLVRYDEDRVDVLRLIVRTCADFPGARVLVIVRTKAQAANVRAGLLACGAGRNVTVCRLPKTGFVEFAKFDLVLVADALDCTWTDPTTSGPAPAEAGRVTAVGLMDRLADVGPATAVVGFRPVHRPLSPFELARVLQLYGVAERVVPRHGGVIRKVVVGWHRVSLRSGAGTARDTRAIADRIINDPVRNRRIAWLARALRAGDRQVLDAAFPDVASSMNSSNMLSVIVICETPKQARALSAQLPGWAVVTNLDAASRPLGFGPIGIVATALGLNRIRHLQVGVVVRADPGTGLPAIPAGWLESDGVEPAPLLVADADDRGFPPAAFRARERKRTYRAAGWTRAGEDPDAAAWALFRTLVLNRGER